MEIEHIEEWIGQDVVDVDGAKVGKLEEIYFRGPDPVLGEIKPGVLSRKRLLVPLLAATASRAYIRLEAPAGRLLQQDHSGAGPSLQDLNALPDAYGAGYALSSDQLESWTSRSERLAAAAAAEANRAETEAEAARRSVDAEDAVARAEAAEEARRAAAQDARGRDAAS